MASVEIISIKKSRGYKRNKGKRNVKERLL